MLDVKRLFSGVGIVIDDQINEKVELPSGIHKIIQTLEEEGFPLIKYDALPLNKNLPHLHSVSFILLDWKLVGDGVSQTESMIKENVEFIKDLKNHSWLPVFIFSNEDKDSIARRLEEEGLTHVLVRTKQEVDTSEKFFGELKEWLKSTPSAYVLKEWERAKRNAKRIMLWDFYDAHKEWPRILSKSISDDGASIDVELIQFLQKNLTSRISYPNISREIIHSVEFPQPPKADLRRLIEHERFVKYTDTDQPGYPLVGDIYRESEQFYCSVHTDCPELKCEYLLNVRPDCDIIRDKKDIYFLKGTILDETKIESGEVVFKDGTFIEKINEVYVAFIEGKIVKFSFRKLEIRKWKEMKTFRIGRLLPPYITRIQQKYSFYLQRQGLPALPNEAIN